MEQKTVTQPTVMERLRAETREYHDRIENELSIFDCIKTESSYGRLLERMWGYYAAKEAALEHVPWEEAGIDFAARRKTPWLAEDLKNLSHEAASLPVKKDVVHPHSLPEAIGSLYVLEGATLGGQVILRHIKQSQIPDAATHFYSAYGEQTSERWTQFKKAANAYCSEESQMRQAIHGAVTTFEEFAAWFETF